MEFSDGERRGFPRRLRRGEALRKKGIEKPYPGVAQKGRKRDPIGSEIPGLIFGGFRHSQSDLDRGQDIYHNGSSRKKNYSKVPRQVTTPHHIVTSTLIGSS
jgi:hypothetical protein